MHAVLDNELWAIGAGLGEWRWGKMIERWIGMALVVFGLIGAVAASESMADETLTCNGLTPTISGSGAIEGTDGNDVIIGSVGPDAVNGHGGNDVICGEGGDDVIDGGVGADQLFGEAAPDDLLDGMAGNDVLNGGSGWDICMTAIGGSGLSRCESVAELGSI